MDSGAVSFFTLHAFNVDDVFLSVHLDNLANLLAFVVSAYDLQIQGRVIKVQVN